MTTTGFDEALLTELTETAGVPGHEDRIREIVRRELDVSTDAVSTDAMGNVVGTVHGDSEYSVAVAAHMDEIGFIVRHINDGFPELDALGGWDARILKAQRVTVHAFDGDLPGIIGSVPPHTLDEKDLEKDDTVEDVRVDLGLPESEVEELVSIGDPVTMDQDTEMVGNNVTGKALDDRICVFAMLEAARRLEDPPVTVHFAATAQEEVGLRGAQALSGDLAPDLAIVMDVTVANDLPGFEEGEHVTRLGDGAAVKLKDSSVITNPKVSRRLRDVAEANDISHQLEVLPRGGTDTARFQNTSGATPVGAISIPTRYLHTPTEAAHVDDVTATIELLLAFLDSETGEFDYTL